MDVYGYVLVDGERFEPGDAKISVFDIALLRGFGCFEALRSYDGVAFRQKQHLDRLELSAAALNLGLPPRSEMDRWVADRAAVGDCTVRVVVTGGTDEKGSGEGSRFIVFAEPLHPVDETISLLPVEAPWHPDGAVSELTGAKTLSYGPNVAARFHAKAEGFGDAVLSGRSGNVLEGPTNTVAWITGATSGARRRSSRWGPGQGRGISATTDARCRRGCSSQHPARDPAGDPSGRRREGCRADYTQAQSRD